MLNFAEKLINLGFLILALYFARTSHLNASPLAELFFVSCSVLLSGLLFDIDFRLIKKFRKSRESGAQQVSFFETSKPSAKTEGFSNGVMNITENGSISVEAVREIAQAETKKLPSWPVYKVYELNKTDANSGELHLIDHLISSGNPRSRRLIVTDIHRNKFNRSTLVRALDGSPISRVICKNVWGKTDLMPYSGRVHDLCLKPLVQYFLDIEAHYDEIVFVMPKSQLTFWKNISEQMQDAKLRSEVYADLPNSSADMPTALRI